MSDKDFRPADTDSAKQHFTHAALEEFARRGRKDDEAFLAKVGEKLDEVDYQTDVGGVKIVAMLRANRAKTFWISAAAAAVIVLLAIPVVQNLTDGDRSANPSKTTVAAANSGWASTVCGPLEKQTLTKLAPITSPLSPHVLTPENDLAGKQLPSEIKAEVPEPVFELAKTETTDPQWSASIPEKLTVDKSSDSQVKSVQGTVPEVTGYSTGYIFWDSELPAVDDSFDLGVIGHDSEKEHLFTFGAPFEEIVPKRGTKNHFNFSFAEADTNNSGGDYDVVRGFDQRRIIDKESAKDELAAVPLATGDTSTFTPYVGYNGSPDSWLADGSALDLTGGVRYEKSANDVFHPGIPIAIDEFRPVSVPKSWLAASSGESMPGANANDVLHGGVRLNVGWGGETEQPLARSPIHDQTKWVNSNTLSTAVSNPEPGHSAGRPNEPKLVSPNEKYGQLIDNPFASPLKEPLSTFSVDVDTASYSNIRRMITSGQMIPTDAVRIEEMINYFAYDYPQPEGQHPFALAVETAQCPWNADHQLLRVAIQGKDLQRVDRPAANLVFLLDVSGSMNEPNKLPLVKKSMELLIEELNERDTISIVVYAGSEGLCLPATSGTEKKKILDSLNCLQAGGSTNGGAGITLAYKMAKENFKADGINRVILCTDGDFNVGRVDNESLVDLVEKKARDGTFLSVLGFGTGNINDSMLEEITNKGNGNYFYIDSVKEGRKVLLEEMMSTLVTIAKDVKIQVEFNPKHVLDYRLIGYANRMLKAEDFANDKVDAGEIGAGHSVTALYEIVPVGAPPIAKEMTNLKYQAPVEPEPAKMKLVESDELCTLKFRYKLPKSDVSIPMEQAVTYQSREWKAASDDYQFAAAVGLWGMLLREAEHCGKGSREMVLEMAKEGCGVDPFGRRNEFIELVKEWSRLKALGGVSQKDGFNGNDVMHGGVRFNVGF